MAKENVPLDGIAKPDDSESVKQPESKKGTDKTGKRPAADKKKMVGRAKFLILMFAVIPYLLYIFWSLFLITVLPDPTGTWDSLIPFAKLAAMIGGLALGMVLVVTFMRVGQKGNATDMQRYMSFARAALFVLPGIALSVYVPYRVQLEPFLNLQLAGVESTAELVAPVAITFNAENATAILRRRGLSVQTYRWDFTGDGEINEETVTPQATAYFDRQGGYNVRVVMALSDGSQRTVNYRLVIPNAVFSYTPIEPVVDDPVRFSVSHLVTGEVDVRSVEWDFDDDGIVDETSTDLETVYTFLRDGPQKVSVTITYENQTQNYYFRTLNISEPKPPPFPISISTTPEFLESPAPFQVVFRVDTEEPLQEVNWDFGDNTTGTGEREGHTFSSIGVYQVQAEARSVSGDIARVNKIVKVVKPLRLPDLTFEGSHTVDSDSIEAEVPVTIELTPKTTRSLVDFFWEAENASDVYSTDTTLRAVYRQEGTYNLVLIGQDAEGAVLRKVITLSVTPRSDNVTFDMNPPTGVAPLEVEFDASDTFIPNETITGFVWSFGDQEGNVQRLGSAKVSHRFERPGTYQVRLTVFTTGNVSKEVVRTIVVRAPALDACFTVSRTEGPAPLGVRFERTCSTGNATKVLWDFGDGSQSDDTSDVVIHEFVDPGRTYRVRLQLEDSAGVTSSTQTTITTY